MEIEKQKSYAFGKDVYFLGADADGVWYWLEAPSWDCNWYWGLGYVETYTNNYLPGLSRDINSHQHFDSMVQGVCPEDFKRVFPETPFSDSELWKLQELMRAMYLARKYSDMLHMGGAHITTNPCRDAIQNSDEYERINKVLIPKMWDELVKILEPQTRTDEAG